MRTWGLNRFNSRQAVLTLWVAFALAPVMLVAQGYFGTVSGELTDATGALVPGAKVVLTRTSKRDSSLIPTSDSNGRYLFRSIPPGVYAVSAEARGFDKATSAEFKAGRQRKRNRQPCPEGSRRQPDCPNRGRSADHSN